jgi:hypothetical protein
VAARRARLLIGPAAAQAGPVRSLGLERGARALTKPPVPRSAIGTRLLVESCRLTKSTCEEGPTCAGLQCENFGSP